MTWSDFLAGTKILSHLSINLSIVYFYTRQVWGSFWPIRRQFKQIRHYDVSGAIQSLSLLDLEYDLLPVCTDSPAEEGSESH